MQSIPGDFWSWVGKFNAEDITGLVAVVAVFGVAAIGLICGAIYKIHKTKSENTLKRELLDRGLSADEIATIVSAQSDKGGARRFRSFWH